MLRYSKVEFPCLTAVLVLYESDILEYLVEERIVFCDILHVGIMIYSVSQKNTPDIFSCNLNKYFPIEIIFGTSIT